MDFSYTEKQEAFRKELRTWLRDNLPDGWFTGDRNIPDEEPKREQFLRDWQRTLYEDNWAGIQWPEEYGGRDASPVEQTIYSEEMAHTNAPRQINSLGINFVGQTLMELGTEEQKERFIPNILSGEEVWCQGYSEPDAGSDIASLTTKAERENDEFIINGQKVWTSAAQYADWCFLVARTDFSGKKHEGITVLLVPMNQGGVTIDPIRQPNDKHEFNQVYFDDAVADANHVVGEVGGGWKAVMTLSSFEHANTMIYEIEQRFNDLVEYCRNNTRDGEPLIQKPRIRDQIAELESRIQAGKLTHYRNVSKHMKTGKPGAEGSMDAVVSNELSVDVENFAMNILGPEATLWEDGPGDGDWASDYIQAYGFWIAAGTPDVQRNIIGEKVLGLPKDIKSETSHQG